MADVDLSGKVALITGGSRGILDYAAAAAGPNSLTEGLAQTLAPKVPVNAIMCGTFSTDISKAIYFASDARTYTTGSIIRVDGGTK